MDTGIDLYQKNLEALQSRYSGALTVQQLATELGCSALTIYRAVSVGTLPPPFRPSGVGHGKMLFWPLPSVAAALSGAWTAQPKKKPTPPSTATDTPRKRGRPRKSRTVH